MCFCEMVTEVQDPGTLDSRSRFSAALEEGDFAYSTDQMPGAVEIIATTYSTSVHTCLRSIMCHCDERQTDFVMNEIALDVPDVPYDF